MDDREVVLYFFKRDEEILCRKISDAARLLKVDPQLIRKELHAVDRLKLKQFVEQGVLIMDLSDYIQEEVEVAKMRGQTLTETDVRRRLKVLEPPQEEEEIDPATSAPKRTRHVVIPYQLKEKERKKQYKALGEADVLEMIKMREAGCKISVIAKQFNCPGQQVADLIST